MSSNLNALNIAFVKQGVSPENIDTHKLVCYWVINLESCEKSARDSKDCPLTEE